MEEGTARHAVCVQGLSLPTDDLDQHLEEIERIASLKIERGEPAFDGRVWILADDIIKRAGRH